MTKLNLLGGLTAAVALSVGFAAQASTSALYSGGGTLAEKVYRDIFNAYGSIASGDLTIGVNTPPSGSPYNSSVEVLYVGVGSGNGKKAYDAYSASLYTSGSRTPDSVPVASTRDFGPFFGTGTGASWVAGLTPAFPKVSFSGSDDPLVAADITAINALGFGPAVQVPGLVTAIAVPFHPTATWNPKGVNPGGGSSTVQLSTNTLCGIFTGKITNWNDANIKKDNNNYQLGSGAITVVFRHDGSGTTFLFSNALINQCGTTSHPVSTYPVPDQWLTDNAITNTAPFTSNDNFFINVFTAGHAPATFLNDNGGFTGQTGGAKGSSGVQQAVDHYVGAIGYVSPDFVRPVATGNDAKGAPISAAANLQTYYTYINKTTPKYLAPTAGNAEVIVSTLTPPSFSGSPAPAANALNWGAVNPTPTTTSAYPIGGFTFIDMYSCYSSATDLAALASQTTGKLGLFKWYYAAAADNNSAVVNTLTKDGFGQLPSNWQGAVNTLLFNNTKTKLGTPKQASTACASVTKGA
jgi:ABC-type phosphate transport system substrate-binding protein